MLRLVQIARENQRRLARVEGEDLLVLGGFGSIYEAVQHCLQSHRSLREELLTSPVEDRLAYDPIFRGESDWRLLSPIDVPENPWRCLVSGTGLTHLGSAKERQAMHAAQAESLTDSMKMFQSGLEFGNPGPGKVGVAPEWFHKGNGNAIRAHLEPLDVPFHAEDGGEEAEVAAIYIVDGAGVPHRIGFAMGNEFSDHVFEKRNYLNLAGSKLRTCSLGPELILDLDFELIPGRVAIQRGGRELWSAQIATGEKAMCHSLQNLEHHHFKFENHRVPGDVHVHFLGAAALSFGSGIKLENGDWMEVSFQGMGRPLRNPIQVEMPEPARLIAVELLNG
jgi:hypothetical protein